MIRKEFRTIRKRKEKFLRKSAHLMTSSELRKYKLYRVMYTIFRISWIVNERITRKIGDRLHLMWDTTQLRKSIMKFESKSHE